MTPAPTIGQGPSKEETGPARAKYGVMTEERIYTPTSSIPTNYIFRMNHVEFNWDDTSGNISKRSKTPNFFKTIQR
jgi:hypothetical protein